MQKYKTFHGRNNITCSTNCHHRTAATLHNLETRFFRYVIANTLYKCDNSDDDDDNNNNNNNRVGIALSLTVRCPTVARSNTLLSSPKHAERLWAPLSLKLGGSSIPSRGSTGRGLKLITHFNLVSRLVISGASLYFP